MSMVADRYEAATIPSEITIPVYGRGYDIFPGVSNYGNSTSRSGVQRPATCSGFQVKVLYNNSLLTLAFEPEFAVHTRRRVD